MENELRLAPSGDLALVASFGNEISEALNTKVRGLMLALEKVKVDGIVEMTPTYCSLMIHYDPLRIGYEALCGKVRDTLGALDDIELPEPMVIEIPTLYGGDYGPDLDYVAKHNGLTVDEVIKIHTSGTYRIYMLGFTPGFPYLGGMDERIATPRLETPRTKIAGGSVGIAGAQTGIYPIDSPGGWQIIGRTPVALYDPLSDEPILLKAGESIRFVPIDQATFDRLSREGRSGTTEGRV
ncbi:5-oxoprolinase subunit PxpB [Acidaminobacter sp.]|uniref:5-oxoprolinase subunit PxpB n=1 Tax=Acidaminobacter sp. TaxID=1872102 RepID=UPI001384AD7F|nr:5-oxoprolinase subunit PxpB [Acidaminobacter sp.]MDK9710620.1 5-oxoprolinase subunit PxpB [Acidaminobacter sp.]MZQ96393.1 5-oxoprolinase subunit PxpB [Acidaminobacter sp.]